MPVAESGQPLPAGQRTRQIKHPSPFALALSFATWCLLIGSLLVTMMGLSHTLLKRLLVSAAALYLAAGYVLGP
ncbi:hypothetical protein [uncultured Azohydromonas sp.]|jgi:hypothetical protein|uniref:hypothetical protein n=1 Tax=uncultured Azohydromonas sp. TaxID=487342 RepID=UPI002629CC97|nr:hypothetical protein [uncultured Azohydromonas sp.]